MSHGARSPETAVASSLSPRVIARSASAAAFVCLVAVLPVGMVVANKSAALVLAVAAAAALVAISFNPDAPDQRAAAWREGRRPLAVVAALLALAVASAALSHRPASGFDQALQMLVPLVATAVVCVALAHLQPPPWTDRLAVVAFGVALALIVSELMTGMWLRRWLGVRDLTFVFNRSLVTLLLVSWPLVAVLALRGRRGQAALLMLALVVVTAMSDSGATTLALAGSMVAFAAACRFRTFARLALLAAVLTALVTAPFHGDIAAWLLGPRLVDAMGSANAGERIRIWQAFGAMVALQGESAFTAWSGYGFGASRTLHAHPVALQLPAEMRALLEHGHPHNAFLQIVTELGRAGTMLFAVVAVVGERAIARLSAQDQPYALAFAVACVAVAAVSHGAWQAWWIAAIGAGLAGFARLCAERHRHHPGAVMQGLKGQGHG